MGKRVSKQSGSATAMYFGIAAHWLGLCNDCMASLREIVAYCNGRTGVPGFPDFPPAHNGLQVDNNGAVSRVAASVDASLETIERAVAAGVDFLIVHHGLFWNPPIPLTGGNATKVRRLLENNLALYSCHLPLDAHPEIGNNALLAKALGLEVVARFFEYQGEPLAVRVAPLADRNALSGCLLERFPQMRAIEYGPAVPQHVAILTGSGASLIEAMASLGVDTLITGEARQHHFVMAQEQGLNVYLCGHTATETFGVEALAGEVAKKFQLPWSAIQSDNPL